MLIKQRMTLRQGWRSLCHSRQWVGLMSMGLPGPASIQPLEAAAGTGPREHAQPHSPISGKIIEDRDPACTLDQMPELVIYHIKTRRVDFRETVLVALCRGTSTLIYLKQVSNFSSVQSRQPHPD